MSKKHKVLFVLSIICFVLSIIFLALAIGARIAPKDMAYDDVYGMAYVILVAYCLFFAAALLFAVTFFISFFGFLFSVSVIAHMKNKVLRIFNIILSLCQGVILAFSTGATVYFGVLLIDIFQV